MSAIPSAWDIRVVQLLESILEAIEHSAMSNDVGFHWESPANRSRTNRTLPRNSGIYDGAAGVALFLTICSELRIKGDVAKLIEGALSTALNCDSAYPAGAVGFFVGRVGVAYASVKYGVCSGDQKWIRDGLAVIERSLNDGEDAALLDYMNGAAGAIAPLLEIGRLSGSSLPLDFAIRLGQTLIRRSNRSMRGWCWGRLHEDSPPLLGLSHGTAGFAVGFSELYRFSGMHEFGYAARRACEYEDSLFDTTALGWPDLRFIRAPTKLDQTPPDLTRILSNAQQTLTRPHIPFPMAWCHGAPGILLARQAVPNRAATAAVPLDHFAAKTNVIMRYPGGDWSLCHGKAGLCTILALISRSHSGEWDDVVRSNLDLLLQELARVTQLAENGVMDCRLMTGDLGVAYAALCALLPSEPDILMMRSSISPVAGTKLPADVSQLVSLDRLAGCDIFLHNVADSKDFIPLLEILQQVEMPEDIHTCIRHHIETSADADFRVQAERAYEVDNTTWALAHSPPALDHFRAINTADSTLPSAEMFELAPTATLIPEPTSIGSVEITKCSGFVVLSTYDCFRRFKCSAFSFSLLQCICGKAQSFNEIVDCVSEKLRRTAINRSELRRLVKDQILYAERAGLVIRQRHPLH